MIKPLVINLGNKVVTTSSNTVKNVKSVKNEANLMMLKMMLYDCVINTKEKEKNVKKNSE